MKKTKGGKIFLTVFSLVFFFCVLGSAVYLLHAMRTYQNPPLVQAYAENDAADSAVYDAVVEADQGFAASLCVGEDNTNTGELNLSSTISYGLFDLEDKSILLSHNLYQRIYPASITKLMTAILTLEYAKPDDIVTIDASDLALEANSQVVGFHVGDRVTVEELLHGLLVSSGNDAAMALARHIGGDTENFVRMMNKRLSEIGATGSHFVNPTGLHDEDHYTTVYDIYLMLNTAVADDHFVSIMQLPSYQLRYTAADGTAASIVISSTDRYLTNDAQGPKDVTILGGKTGTTTIAGHCLTLYAQNAYGQPYISVVVGAQNTERLYEDMNTILACINKD